MSVLMELHESRKAARERLGMPITPEPRVRFTRSQIAALPARVRRDTPIPSYMRRKPKPLLTPKMKPHGPPDGEQWPAQPNPVFYDEAAAPPAADWQGIMQDACRNHDVELCDMLGPRHFAKLALARAEAAFRMVVELRMSYAAIGRRMNRDSTTIIAAINRHCRAVPGAEVKVRAARAAVRRDRQALKEEAVQLYLYGGKTISQITDLLPLSDQTIRSAVKKWAEWQ